MQVTFERYEKKYRLTRQQFERWLYLTEKYLFEDVYSQHTIGNIYYDTMNHELIRQSMDKPIYKEKLRLRCYGLPDDKSDAFLELKKKYQGIVYKRRVILPYQEAIAYLEGRQRPDMHSQIMQEIDYFIHLYQLYPQMMIAYDRVAYSCPFDPQIRVTIDQNIRYRVTQLDLRKGFDGQQLLAQDQMLMEIKVPSAMPFWMVDALRTCDLMPVSFSKYGQAYSQTGGLAE